MKKHRGYTKGNLKEWQKVVYIEKQNYCGRCSPLPMKAKATSHRKLHWQTSSYPTDPLPKLKFREAAG